jgi:hypothetical protein
MKMKKGLRVISFLIFSVIISNIFIRPTYAALTEENSLSTINVILDGTTIEVPIVEGPITKIEPSSKNVDIANYSGKELYHKDATLYIPVTEDALNYNEEIVNNIKARLVTTDQGLDPRGYLKVTSTINYTSDYYNGNKRIDMTSFSITKNRGPDTYNLIGIGNPDATAYQLGFHGPAGYPEVMDQKKSYRQFSWGSTQVIPSSWLPVTTDVYASYLKGVQYNANLIYYTNSSQTSTTTVKLSFFHKCG